jgi:hypothetical protein
MDGPSAVRVSRASASSGVASAAPLAHRFASARARRCAVSGSVVRSG